jgi:hypothetical protein
MVRKVNEASLKNVMEFWVKAYKLKKGEELYNYEWYLDPVKEKVFFILYLARSANSKRI